MLLIETISGFLVLSKLWKFPVSSLKCLFLNQRKSLVAETNNSNATLGKSVAFEYKVASSA